MTYTNNKLNPHLIPASKALEHFATPYTGRTTPRKSRKDKIYGVVGEWLGGYSLYKKQSLIMSK